MTKRSYWLDLFTGVTWNEFKESGGKVSGFRESRWTTVQKVKSAIISFAILPEFQDSSVFWKLLGSHTKINPRSGKTKFFLAA
jgi:hypothetical protein